MRPFGEQSCIPSSGKMTELRPARMFLKSEIPRQSICSFKEWTESHSAKSPTREIPQLSIHHQLTRPSFSALPIF